VNADLELDCRGPKCPLPVIRLATDIGDLGLGRTLTVAAHGLPRSGHAG
jgi:TusA-related sulfurtransferase